MERVNIQVCGLELDWICLHTFLVFAAHAAHGDQFGVVINVRRLQSIFSTAGLSIDADRCISQRVCGDVLIEMEQFN